MGRSACSSCCKEKEDKPCVNKCDVCVYPCIDTSTYPPSSSGEIVSAANPLINNGENPTLEECWVKGYENYTAWDFNCPCNESKFDWVLLICNVNASRDDEFSVCLNGYRLGDITELGKDRCQGKFFATSAEAVELVKSTICDIKVEPQCCVDNTSSIQILDDKTPFLFGGETGSDFHLCMQNKKNNNNSNYGFVGIFRVHTYKDEDGKTQKSVCPLEPHGEYIGDSGESLEVNFGSQKLCPDAKEAPIGPDCDPCVEDPPYGWLCYAGEFVYDSSGEPLYWEPPHCDYVIDGYYETKAECEENCVDYCYCPGADEYAADRDNPCLNNCTWKWMVDENTETIDWVLQWHDPEDIYGPCESFSQGHLGIDGICDDNPGQDTSCQCWKPETDGEYVGEERSLPCQRCDENRTWSCQPTSAGYRECQLGYWGPLESYENKQDCMDHETECMRWSCIHEDTVEAECIEDFEGIFVSQEECEESCVPVKMFKCNCENDECECIEDPDGAYESLEACKENCECNEERCYPDRWECIDGECSPSVEGEFLTLEECQAPLGGCHRWACNEGECEEDATGEFKTQEECEAKCEPVSWSCVDGEQGCEELPEGEGDYSSRLECDEACFLYDCANGDCVTAVGGQFDSMEECQEDCVTRWTCDDTGLLGICIKDADGEYATLGECERDCEDKTRWNCVDGECEEGVGGEFAELEACLEVCGKDDMGWECVDMVGFYRCLFIKFGQHATKEDCLSTCVGWSCEGKGFGGDNECVEVPEGHYYTREDCLEGGCEEGVGGAPF